LSFFCIYIQVWKDRCHLLSIIISCDFLVRQKPSLLVVRSNFQFHHLLFSSPLSLDRGWSYAMGIIDTIRGAVSKMSPSVMRSKTANRKVELRYNTRGRPVPNGVRGRIMSSLGAKPVLCNMIAMLDGLLQDSCTTHATSFF